jgi:hypothetical protein
MIKKICFLMFFVFLNSYSQDNGIIVILLDKSTNTVIEDATITVLRTNQGLLSNKDGVFKLNLNRVSLIEISHTSYEKIRIKSTSLKDKENIIYLESNTNNLEEIVLTREDPHDILKKIVKTSIKKIKVPANLKVYTREFYKKNGNYTYYNDGLLNFQILGDYKNIKTDILVEQNRSVGLLDEFDKSILGYNLNNLMENYYKFKYIEELLDSKAKKKYSFQIKSYAQNDNYNYLVVKPLTTVIGEFYQFSILYDSKSKLIMEINSSLPLDRVNTDAAFLDFNKRKVYKSEFKTTYRLDNQDYYLVNSKEEIGFVVKENKKEVKVEIKNYFITTQFRSRIFKYKDEEVFKDKSLINKTDSVITAFWEDDSGIILTKDEEAILKSLVNRN